MVDLSTAGESAAFVSRRLNLRHAPLLLDSQAASEGVMPDGLARELAVSGELGRQALVVAMLGSPFVSQVLLAADRALPRTRQCARIFAHWPGDRAADALAMRFNAALHALARSGKDADLTALYAKGEGDFDGVIARAMWAHDGELARWLAHPTQTNETARSAATMAALKLLTARFDLPLELLELGASAGLNLNLSHYHYDLGGQSCGPAASPVQIAPLWHGAPPSAADPVILRARGVDLSPLDLRCAPIVERLHAFVWADKADRREHLEQALVVAKAHPPQVDQGDAVPWLAQQLGGPPALGRCRVVVHSMFRQYLSAAKRAALDGVLNEAFARAIPQAPLARLGLEWTQERSEVRLTLALSAGAGVEQHHLATCHPYGDWIHWRG
jgi:hypothetical protein